MSDEGQTSGSGSPWVGTMVSLLCVSGASFRPNPKLTTVYSDEKHVVAIAHRASEALEIASELLKERRACAMLVGEYSDALVARVIEICKYSSRGQLTLTLATQDLVRDLCELHFSDLGKVNLFNRTERLFAAVVPSNEPRKHEAASYVPQIFIGRSEALAEVRHLMDNSRLVTVFGPAGSGKSALLRRLCAEIEAFGEDDVTYVDLAGISHPSLVASAIVVALDLRKLPQESDEDAVVAYFRGSRSRILVLDGAEQVALGIRSFVNRLLSHCRQLAILIGSQKALQISAEARLILEGMDCPSELDSFEDIKGNEAVAVFEDAARMLDPKFRVTEKNARDIAALVRVLDGMPLAIRLAAARSRTMEPRQLCMRIEDCFDLLTGTTTQLSLKDAVSFSYNLLDPNSRVLLRRLGVFRGVFCLEWATEVCSDELLTDDVLLRALEDLLDSSFISPLHTASPQRMFALKNTMAVFARRELKAAGEAKAFEERRRQWLQDLITTATEELSGLKQAEWFQIMDAALPEIEEVVRLGAHPRGNADGGIRVLVASFPYLWERCMWTAGLNMCSALFKARDINKAASYGKLLNMLAAFTMGLQRQRESAHFALLSLRYARSRASAVEIGCAWSAVASAWWGLSDSFKARRAYLAAYEAFKNYGDEARLLSVIGNIIGIETDLELFSEARAHLKIGIPLAKRSQDLSNQANLYQNAAHLALSERDYKGGLEWARNAAEIYVSQGSSDQTSRAFRNCCYALVGLGKHVAAATLWHGIHTLGDNALDKSDREQIRFAMAEIDLRKHLGDAEFESAKEKCGQSYRELLNTLP